MFVKGMDGTVGMGHKKARRACAVRALRTSSDDSGNHRWRILGWRPCNWWGRWLCLLGILIFCGEGKAQKEWR